MDFLSFVLKQKKQKFKADEPTLKTTSKRRSNTKPLALKARLLVFPAPFYRCFLRFGFDAERPPPAETVLEANMIFLTGVFYRYCQK